MALLDVDVALDRILSGVKPLATELIDLHRASGRILAVDVVAKRNQPPFNSSAMDGYAVRHADLMQTAGKGTSSALRASSPEEKRLGAIAPQTINIEGGLRPSRFSAGEAARRADEVPLPAVCIRSA